jgi:hypothetical protein
MPDFDPTKTWIKTNLKHERQITLCRFSPCGRFVFGAGLESALHRWELETGAHVEFQGHGGWVTSLAFHPDGKRLFSGDSHGGVLGWEYAAPVLAPSRKASLKGWVRTLTVDGSGRHLIAGGCDGELLVLSPETGKPLRSLSGHRGHVFSCARHPTGEVITGDLFGELRTWDVASGRCMRTIPVPDLHTRLPDFLADVGGVRALAFDPTGTRLACGGLTAAESNTFCPGTPVVVIVDWATGKIERRLNATSRVKVDGFVNAVRYLADGTLCGYAEGTSGAALWFWKPGESEPFHSLAGPTGYDLDLHPDGVTLAAALYENRGHSGNGRRAKNPAEYVSNAGIIRLFALHAK